MKGTYVQTKWIDNKTPVNAANLNKLECAVGELYSRAISYSQLKEGNGINIQSTKDKDIEISVSDNVLTSDSFKGIETVFNCSCTDRELNKLYLVLCSETKKLLWIELNGVKIFEVKEGE